ncbi:MAG TPA: hypothetical protein VEL74_10820 [Thermoanaerobaculia bacterium]|nr:hypothetical protein [Thermoanaerobaculia bacterium]
MTEPGPEGNPNAMSQKVGDEALRAKTGRIWEEWFAVLDDVGAVEKGHTEIARYLHEEMGVDGWWAQMVTTGYEQARGKRVKHQKADGYEVSASKTLPVPLDTLFQAWQDDTVRGRWLPEPGVVVRKANPGKTMRLGWPDKTLVAVYFSAKGEDKSAVQVQHGKLPDSGAAARMKSWWGETLERLRAELQA